MANRGMSTILLDLPTAPVHHTSLVASVTGAIIVSRRPIGIVLECPVHHFFQITLKLCHYMGELAGTGGLLYAALKVFVNRHRHTSSQNVSFRIDVLL
jgi:hypothetical protein